MRGIGGLAGAGQAQLEKVAADMAPRQVTILENLRDRRERLSNQLKELDEAIAALQENPEVERVLSLVSRLV